jgi:hypothetical protein
MNANFGITVNVFFSNLAVAAICFASLYLFTNGKGG